MNASYLKSIVGFISLASKQRKHLRGEYLVINPYSISFTDFSMAIDIMCKTGTEKPVAVNIKELESILKSCDKTSWVDMLELSQGRVAIDRQIWNVGTKDACDVPYWEPIADSWEHVTSHNLARALPYVNHSINKDDSRYNLNTLFLASNGDAVSTDGHRMSLFGDVDTTNENGLMIPGSIINLLTKQKLFKLERLSVLTSDKRVRIVSQSQYHVQIEFMKIDGDYPQFQKVIPRDLPIATYHIDKKQFAMAIKKAAAFLDKRNRGIHINMNGSVVVKDKDNKVESCVNSTSANTTDIELIINVDYINDAISRIDSVCFDLNYFGEGKPVVFGDALHPERFQMIMPMRK